MKSPPLTLLTGSILRARVNTLIRGNNSLSMWDIAIYLEKPHKYVAVRPPLVWTTWLAAISSRCLTALPAKMCAFSSYITCGKTATTVTWSEPFAICYHAIVTQQRLIVKQMAPEICNLRLQPKERVKWTALILCLHCTGTVNWLLCIVSRQTNCHLEEFTQLTGIKLLILRFLEIFAS